MKTTAFCRNGLVPSLFLLPFDFEVDRGRSRKTNRTCAERGQCTICALPRPICQHGRKVPWPPAGLRYSAEHRFPFVFRFVERCFVHARFRTLTRAPARDATVDLHSDILLCQYADQMHDIDAHTGPSSTGKGSWRAIGQSRTYASISRRRRLNIVGAFHPVNLSAIPSER